MRKYVMTGMFTVAMAAVLLAQHRTPQFKSLGPLPDAEMESMSAAPNGKLVAISGESAEAGLLIFDLTRSRARKVVDGIFWDVDWSPKGDRIVFGRPDENNQERIWILPVDPNTGTPRGAPRRISRGAGDSPKFSPDGKTVAFAAFGANGQNLVVLSADGGPERTVAEYAHNIYPTYWSADGKYIHLVAGSGRPNGDPLVRVALANGQQDTIARGMMIPALSPNLRLLAFRAGFDTLVLKVRDGRELSRVVIPPTGEHYPTAWNAASNALFSVVTVRKRVLKSIDLATGAITTVSAPSTEEWWPTFSPDSKRIASLGVQDGNTVIVVRDRNGRNARAYRFFGTLSNRQIDWSPDGRLIAARIGANRSTTQLQLLDLASGKVKTLVRGQIGQAAWLRDGSGIRYVTIVKKQGIDHRVINEVDLKGNVREILDPGPLVLRQGVILGGPDTAMWGTPDSIRIIDLSRGKTVTTIHFPPSMAPSFSPDRKWLIRVSSEPIARNVRAVYLGSTSTGEVRTIPLSFPTLPTTTGTVWLDNDHVVVPGHGGSNEPAKLYLLSIATGTTREIASIAPEPSGGSTTYAGAPDGSAVVFAEIVGRHVTLSQLDFAPLLKQ